MGHEVEDDPFSLEDVPCASGYAEGRIAGGESVAIAYRHLKGIGMDFRAAVENDGGDGQARHERVLLGHDHGFESVFG